MRLFGQVFLLWPPRCARVGAHPSPSARAATLAGWIPLLLLPSLLSVSSPPPSSSAPGSRHGQSPSSPNTRASSEPDRRQAARPAIGETKPRRRGGLEGPSLSATSPTNWTRSQRRCVCDEELLRHVADLGQAPAREPSARACCASARRLSLGLVTWRPDSSCNGLLMTGWRMRIWWRWGVCWPAATLKKVRSHAVAACPVAFLLQERLV